MPSLEKYRRELDYTYAPGLFPAMEALIKRPECVMRVLISEKAISRLRYLASSPVDAEACFRKRCERDLRARSAYLGRGVRESIDEYDIMMEDLVLGRVKRDDPRIQ